MPSIDRLQRAYYIYKWIRRRCTPWLFFGSLADLFGLGAKNSTPIPSEWCNIFVVTHRFSSCAFSMSNMMIWSQFKWRFYLRKVFDSYFNQRSTCGIVKNQSLSILTTLLCISPPNRDLYCHLRCHYSRRLVSRKLSGVRKEVKIHLPLWLPMILCDHRQKLRTRNPKTRWGQVLNNMKRKTKLIQGS